MPRRPTTARPFLCIALPLMLIAPALAQEEAEPDTRDPCALQEDRQKGQHEAEKDGKALGDRLSRCGDVIRPPSVGDPELVKPAPKEGETPVIRPKELPRMPQNDDPIEK